MPRSHGGGSHAAGSPWRRRSGGLREIPCRSRWSPSPRPGLGPAPRRHAPGSQATITAASGAPLPSLSGAPRPGERGGINRRLVMDDDRPSSPACTSLSATPFPSDPRFFPRSGPPRPVRNLLCPKALPREQPLPDTGLTKASFEVYRRSLQSSAAGRGTRRAGQRSSSVAVIRYGRPGPASPRFARARFKTGEGGRGHQPSR